ncbi:hypothetical protein Rcae01_01239 [Novipirellula caenicola]|uniref:Zeta toxin n=2 Tax=Novipirellula caenicola TaxID=1536901 RepID=A0ABP9VPX8_9BACT
MANNKKLVYLMRGLPGCGKSHLARRLAAGKGVVLETDQYFYSQVGDDPASYDYSEALLPAARQWNFERFRQAIRHAATPIVVDRGNGLNLETRRYVALAYEHGYRVELAEPDSSWWLELRVLLKYQRYVDRELLDAWAERLAESTRQDHRVPAATIRHWMSHWRHDLTVDQILAWNEPNHAARPEGDDTAVNSAG